MSSYVVSNGTFYAVPARSNELYHYGVKGMKWGKRKASYYEAKASSHAAAVGTSKTRLGKNYHNYRAYRNEVKAGDRKNTESGIKGSGGALKYLDNKWGHGANTRIQNAASKYYDRKSSYTKTDIGTSIAKANAYNLKTAANANARLHNSKNLSQYGANYINAVANRSIKTWSGRTTTTGKRYVDSMLTGGMIGLGMDVNHYSKKQAAARNKYKSNTDKAFSKYESTIADIEKNYKRGQNLSEKDQARESAAEKKYADEIAKAKAQYKKDRRK